MSTSHTPSEEWRLNSWSLWPSRRGSYWTLDVRWSRLRLRLRLSLSCRRIIKSYIRHKSPKWGNPSCWAQLWKQGSYVSRFQSWKSGPEEILLTTASGTAMSFWDIIMLTLMLWFQSMDDKNNDKANLVAPSADSDAPRHCSWRPLQVECEDVLRIVQSICFETEQGVWRTH